MNNTLSKEEILDKHIDISFDNILELNYGQRADGIHAAMDEYTKQECIEFMKWKGESDWCEWGGFFVNATTEETVTHDDLYDKYLLHKQNNQ